MSVHIDARPGDIAEAVLLPGDPLRAQYIAETFLENAVCYNRVRGMLGFTGTWRGKKVSVQGTGMGVPSASIYIHELVNEFRARKLVRIGTCGALRPDIGLREVIIAQAACTDSSINRRVFGAVDFAPIADFGLMKLAHEIGSARSGLKPRVGNVFSSDLFYSDDNALYEKLARYGVLAVEMETAALYTLSAKFGTQALSLLTVSDSIATGEQTTPMERQTTFNDMIEIALETITA
jgi:purine-nucleoside phosphorylase